MDTKSKVLSFLIENEGLNISGEKIANSLDISRTSIWQAINKLKQSGHTIESRGNKGYCYIKNNVISSEAIKHYLAPELKDINIMHFEEIDSTNKTAKIELLNGALDKTVIIANSQTKSYGRFERPFFSDKDGGIYLSIILKPKIISDNIPLITIKTAIAEKRTIDNFSSEDTKIKWINDLFLKGKKVSGILTEGIVNYETNSISSIIVGIGINFSIEKFPKDLKNVATSIFKKNTATTRNEFIAYLLTEFFSLYESNDEEAIIEEYKKASLVLGKDISFVINNIEMSGKAVDINKKGELIVELDNKEQIALFSGEISIKF